MATAQLQLRQAAYDGTAKEVQKILRNNPELDINASLVWSKNALHIACEEGHDSVVSVLLAHPNIDVNLADSCGFAPFVYACQNKRISCLRLMLSDARVEVNRLIFGKESPLCRAIMMHGNITVVQWWIASGREMNLGSPENDLTDATTTAKITKQRRIALLLKNFKENPDRTRYEVKLHLGFKEVTAAAKLALAVFVSDGLLAVSNENKTASAAKFFYIASQLPLELQMILCYRTVRSTSENIPGQESERAFRHLAKTLL